MPGPGLNPSSVEGALQSLKLQIDRLSRRAVAPADGGLLGWQELTVAMPTALSDSVPVQGTALTTPGAYGNPGIGGDAGSGDVTYCDDSLPCLYIVVIKLVVTPTTNAVSGDVHQIALNDSVTDYTNQTIIGTGDNRVTFTGLARLTAPVTFPPQVTIKCTGGTNRAYTLSPARYEIARFAAAL